MASPCGRRYLADLHAHQYLLAMQPFGIQTVPLRTPTLPPATHTNTYVVGQGKLSVFDPATPYKEEQAQLESILDGRIGETVERIVLTHHHHDHVLGATSLQAFLAKQGVSVPILAHPITAKLLENIVPIDSFWLDGQTLECGGVSMTGTHTPGHAPGHLVFQSHVDQAIIAGDMVAGTGTILIEPKDGNLALYLDSLQRMRALKPSILLPSHGPPLIQADEVLSMYIAHRHLRTDQIREALDRNGRQTPLQLAKWVYATLPAAIHGLAALQVESHLIWMQSNGLSIKNDDQTWSPRTL